MDDGAPSLDADPARSDDDGEFPPRSKWTAGHAADIRRTADTVTAVTGPPGTDPAAGVHVWDTWLLRDRHGRVTTVDGWRVLFSLTAPADLLPGKRHDAARIRYFYSRDGRTWRDGGPVFHDGALGQRQWAGSALYDDSELYLYYTAAGDDGAPELTYTQRIAVAHGGRVAPATDGVAINGPWTQRVLLEPDGHWYETAAQSRGMTYTFRDPWFFEDPATGRSHLLFEANTPVPEGSDACEGNSQRQAFNGSIGVAASPTGDPLEWELRPPLLDAVCVNQELERPHVVLADGRYYLFFSSHRHTFAPGLEGFDGLYGFVADSFRGPYRPLNGSGLVLTNPATAPFQAYSWMAFRHREEVLVQSFANYHDFDGRSLDEIADLSPAEQRRRFGGTLSSTVRLAIDGDRTRVRGTLPHWHLPTEDESLPAVGDRDPPAPEDIDDAPESRAGPDWRCGGYRREEHYRY